MHTISCVPREEWIMSEPIERHRRSGRNQASSMPPAASAAESAAVQPEQIPAAPAAPAETVRARHRAVPSPAPEAPASRPAPSGTPGVRRASQARRSIQETRSDTAPVRDREVQRMPLWLMISLGVMLLVCLGLFASTQFMNAYLNRQEQERQAQHEALLRAHPLQYTDLIEKYAGMYNLEPGYVAAIILNESSYQPHAESGVGARGLMQLMEDTAGWIARRIGDSSYAFDRLWEPETNIRYGCWYLNYLSGLFGGDPVCVTSAYHAGQGTVTGWLLDPRWSSDGITLNLDTMPEGPTKIYAGRVTKDYAIYDALYFHHLNALPDPGSDT